VDLFSVVFMVVDEADKVCALGMADQLKALASHVRPDAQVRAR